MSIINHRTRRVVDRKQPSDAPRGEAAELFRATNFTITRWTRQGALTPFHTLGGHKRFRAVESSSRDGPDLLRARSRATTHELTTPMTEAKETTVPNHVSALPHEAEHDHARSVLSHALPNAQALALVTHAAELRYLAKNFVAQAARE